MKLGKEESKFLDDISTEKSFKIRFHCETLQGNFSFLKIWGMI